MSKTIFCTFADTRIKKSLKRIKYQAENMNYFDEIIIHDENSLDKLFIKKFKSIVNSNLRGFGYWIWKPQILKQMLTSMSDDDMLLYVDAGCHLNPSGLNKLKNYFLHLKNSDHFILATELGMEYSEKFWTKGDLFDYFKVRDNAIYTDSPQIQATVIFIKKKPQAVNFLNQWLLVYETNFSLVDDTVSVSPNFDGFIQNRHDQSIFSLLCKRIGVELIPGSDIYRSGDWSQMQQFPIWAMRDKKYSLLSRILFKLSLMK